MKVLLIEPCKSARSLGGEDFFVYEPLALEYLAAGIKDDHDVRILDLRLDKDLPAALQDFRPDIVGLTSYTVHVNMVKKLSETIKRWDPDVLTVVGGHHATIMPADFVCPTIDLVVSGEGVITFREIVTRFQDEEPFEGIPGLAFSGGVAAPPSMVSIDLDELPFPDRSRTARYRKQYYSEWMKPLASIRTSKGCPFRCNFCALWKLTGGLYLRRKPESILAELAEIEEEFVFFADDESLVDTNRMMRLAKLIKEAGIKKRYFLYGRSDTITKHPDLLEAWKEVGLERIFVGLEFFRDEDLKYVKKKSSVEDNDGAIRVLHDLDIDVYASFIIRPEFTKEDFKSFRRYCRSLELNFASYSVLTPLPGSDLYDEVKSSLLTHDYDYFDFIHTLLPTKLPIREFYEEYILMYKKGVSFRNGMAILGKFPWRDLPTVFKKTSLWYRTLRAAHLDYEANAPVARAH